MLRTKFVRRAVRLLGAVTAAGVLSLGVVVTLPASAQTSPHHWITDEANGIKGTSDSGDGNVSTANGI